MQLLEDDRNLLGAIQGIDRGGLFRTRPESHEGITPYASSFLDGWQLLARGLDVFEGGGDRLGRYIEQIKAATNCKTYN